MTPFPFSGPLLSVEYDVALRLEEFRKLRGRGALCTTVTEQLATESASAILNSFQTRGEYLRDAVTLLAEIATLEEPCLSQPGQRATFPFLIETLSDSFEPEYCRLYDRIFAQMVTICRQMPAAKELNETLARFGLHTEHDLLERKHRLRNTQTALDASARQKVKKVLILSRVTIGADVAITSVALQKAKVAFPQAELVLLGSPKLAQLFGGDNGVHILKVHYHKNGSLLDRLQSWLPLEHAIEEQIAGLTSDEYLVIDPDSRLLQLGLLPALDDDSRYFFLESRCFGEMGQGSMSQITGRWLSNTMGGGEVTPSVSLRNEDRIFGQEVFNRLRKSGSAFLVAASFGVGGNDQKRLADPFEANLLSRLIEDGCTVLLDKGAGEEERDRADRLVRQLRSSGRTVIEMNQQTAGVHLDREALRGDLLTWQGEIGAFAGLVENCDEYIGYDSAGQHIAAALGVRVVDIFTGSASPVFRERWTPSSRAVVKMVAIEDGSATESALAEVLACHRAIRTAATRDRRP